MHTIRIPNSIRIGNRCYTISLKDSLIADHNHFGIVNHATKHILIDSSLPNSEMTETFIHEVVHIILNMYSLDIEGVGNVEFLCNSMGIMLTQLLDYLGVSLEFTGER